MFQRTNFAGPSPAEEHWHKQVKRFVTVAGENERRETSLGHLDAKLFAQLADKAGFWRFAGLDLAARKLPQTCQLLALWTLAQKNAAIAVHQGAGGDE